MEDIVPLVAVISPFAFTLVLIWMVLHYRDRRRAHEAQTPRNVDHVRLEAVAEKMEKRIDALEQILDAEAPGWRKKPHEH